jgi:hypothetical protein
LFFFVHATELSEALRIVNGLFLKYLAHRALFALIAARRRAGDPFPAAPPSFPSATACLFFLFIQAQRYEKMFDSSI